VKVAIPAVIASEIKKQADLFGFTDQEIVRFALSRFFLGTERPSDSLLARAPAKEPIATAATAEGFIYLAVRASDGVYKIGFSSHPNARIKQLEKQLGEPIKLVCTWDVGRNRMAAVEKEAHLAFGEFRVSGEWFRLNEPLIKSLGILLSRHAINGGGAN
jgi:hypothetical protein